MKKRDYKKEFSTLIDKFAYRYSRWQVWNDFLSLLSLANVMPGPENGEREEQYLSIMDSYQKEDQEAFPKMLGLVVLALEENPEQDFLGSLYHYLDLQQEQKGHPENNRQRPGDLKILGQAQVIPRLPVIAVPKNIRQEREKPPEVSQLQQAKKRRGQPA